MNIWLNFSVLRQEAPSLCSVSPSVSFQTLMTIEPLLTSLFFQWTGKDPTIESELCISCNYEQVVERCMESGVLDGRPMSIREQPFSLIIGLVYNKLPIYSLKSCQFNWTIAWKTTQCDVGCGNCCMVFFELFANQVQYQLSFQHKYMNLI